ncbi:MAG TPA: SDR family NAD(P)-dependent oxidoreductase [Microthrixaceae bacterium]|nr:SDR family NAD(P)-dependent oxidoreductase [Microthrixaceae bacterium]HMS11782.1 SDR family NAD(P)-dependent oxidoreductase [Microthrixaceae bacterium]HMT26116.1 SDR family NAD(P)-dependent oxidoreductase [Microthrixaceae bacterium]HMT61880.1 SDR family NAD(P)-dependent oxidoreductase [Microthrixaceae bacterium]
MDARTEEQPDGPPDPGHARFADLTLGGIDIRVETEDTALSEVITITTVIERDDPHRASGGGMEEPDVIDLRDRPRTSTTSQRRRTDVTDRRAGSDPLAGKFAVVTGATFGVGRAVAHALAATDARVCVVGHDVDALRRTVAEAPGGTTLFLRGDLADSAQIDSIADFVDRIDRPIDILVHAAGTPRGDSLTTATVAQLDDQYATHVRGPFLLSQRLLPSLRAARGHVVFVNTSAALRSSADGALYSMTRAGMRMLADGIRDDARADGVRVTSIYPDLDNGSELAADDIAANVLHALRMPPGVEITDIQLRAGIGA